MKKSWGKLGYLVPTAHLCSRYYDLGCEGGLNFLCLDALISESFQKNMSEVYLIFPILKACEFFLILIVSPFKERHPHDFFNAELSALGSDPGARLDEL